jgi:sigma-B regulation protein RsbU (phosphoserine phosphatase)
MALTRTFKVSGLVLALGVVLIVLGGVTDATAAVVIGILLVVFDSPVFFVSAVRHLLRGILWRVGSRLFVSYVLIGVVPLPFFVGLAYVGIAAVCGQLAGRRLERAQAETGKALSDELARLSSSVVVADGPEARAALFHAAMAARAAVVPRLSWAFIPANGEPEGEGALGKPPVVPASLLGQGGIKLLLDRKAVFAALATTTRSGTLLLYLPLGKAFAQRLADTTGTDLGITTTAPEPRAAGPKPERKSGRVAIQTDDEDIPLQPVKDGDESASATGANATGSGPIRGRWVAWGIALEEVLLSWPSGAEIRDGKVVIGLRTSIAREMKELYGEARFGRAASSSARQIVVQILTGLTAFVVFVYVAAALLAALLVVRIARASKRLSTGFAEIDRGNFAYRAKLRGKDQLAGLVTSFNQMASHLQESVSERAAKEVLEHELSIARDLQRRLLPSRDFRFEGLEIAVDFRPAAAIGGDFYHFVVEGPRRLAVVIADVSGHGLSTGIVMASTKASLSALATTRAGTVSMLTSLDDEVRKATDSRTFVTLGHLVLDLDAGTVELTNAGHPYPYRVTKDGRVSALANPSLPLGVGLPAKFQTVTERLEKGDTWVLFSDGIVEALSPAGELFSFERLEALLAELPGEPAEAVKERVLAAWRLHTGHDAPEDDRTLLVIRVVSGDTPG